MSFMSDLMLPLESARFASEWSFLAKNPKKEERREYWNNALGLLKTFILEKSPSVIGLQEMNLSGLTFRNNTGTHAIDTMLIDINLSKNTKYTQLSRSVPTNDAGLSIIWDENKIGIIYKFMHLDNPNQLGRPLLLVVTKKGNDYYLLINIHGAQDAKLRTDMTKFNEYMIKNNKETIETETTKFLGTIKPTNIFVMGDFNDRYDAIKNIEIAGKKIFYNGTAPKSCCHNWDSACEDTDLELPFTCKEQPEPRDLPNKKPLPDGRGSIKNYRYAGDKVFGLNPIEDIQIYNYKERQGIVSNESDHELVYATYSDTVSSTGGRRNVKKSRKQRKSRRNKTMRH